MTWLVDGMEDKTNTRCTDGSYHRKLAPKVSRPAWITYFIKFNNRMIGNSFEIPEDANSHRGLGLCTIHHLVSALFMF